MQIWTPHQQPRDDGEFPVRLNSGTDHPFAVIPLSEDGLTALIMQSPGDCDRLIRAAILAKKALLLDEATTAAVPRGTGDDTPVRRALDPERDDWDGEELASGDAGTDAS